MSPVTADPHAEIAAALTPQDEIKNALGDGAHDEIASMLKSKKTWQDEVTPVKLPNGIQTVMRPDGYVWLDDSKVAPGEKKQIDGPGWHTPNLWGGWKRGPSAPDQFTPSDENGQKRPQDMGDAEIATRLLGLTPEQYLHMSNSALYRPGDFRRMLALDGPNANPTIQGIEQPAKSLYNGALTGANAFLGLAQKPGTWMGDSSAEDHSIATGRLLKLIQNMNQGRNPQQGGFDPLHMIGQYGSLNPGTTTAKTVDQALAKEAPEAVAGLTGKLIRGGEAAPGVVRDTFLRTQGDVKDRATAAGAAGVMTPAFSATGDYIGTGVQKLINLGKGIWHSATQTPQSPLPGVAGEVQALADQHGVNVQSHNLVNDPASEVKSLGELTSAAPIGGLGKTNTAQQKEAQIAANNFVSQLKDKMKGLGYENMNALKAAAAAKDPRAVALLKMADEAGNNLPEVIQANGNINLWANQRKVDHAFDRARSLDTGAVGAPEDVAPMTAKVDELLARQEALGEANQNKPLVEYLKKVKRDLSGRAPVEGAAPIQGDGVQANGSGDSAASVEAINRAAQEQALGRTRALVNLRTGQVTRIDSNVDSVDMLAPPNTAIMQKGVGKDPNAWVILDHNSKMPQHEVDAAMPRVQAQLSQWEKTQPPPPTPEAASKFQPTYSALADYRKGIQSKRQNIGKPGSELTGDDATGALRELQGATEDSMRSVGELSPGVAKADRYARDLHKELVVPFKNRALVKSMTTDTPDVMAAKFNNMSPDQIQEILPALGEKGKAAVRASMVERGVQQSMDRTRPDDYQFQPLVFAAKMKDPKFAESLGLTVPKGGEDKWALDGLTNLMSHLDDAGKVASTKGAFTLTQRMLGEPSVAMKWLLTTKPGKQFLLQASDLKAGSPELAAIVEKINHAIPAQAGAQTTEAVK